MLPLAGKTMVVIGAAEGWAGGSWKRLSPNEQIDVDLFILRSLILLIFSAGRACARKASNSRRIRR